EGHAMDARAESFDFLLNGPDIAEVVRFFKSESFQLGLGFAQFGATGAGQGDASRMRRAQGTYDVDARGVALVADAGAHGLEGFRAGEVALDQVGQLQVLEHEIEEFLLGDLKNELVHALAGVARLAAASSATTALRARDALAGGEFLVAGVDDGLLAAAAVMQHRLVDIAAGNADLLAVLHVGDGASADGFLHRLLDVLTVTPQKALAVHRALVLAVEASVDHIAH